MPTIVIDAEPAPITIDRERVVLLIIDMQRDFLDCGVTTEVCVHTTVREANDRGYRCVVPSDACASYFPQFHAIGLEMIKAQGGIFGCVSDSRRVLGFGTNIPSSIYWY